MSGGDPELNSAIAWHPSQAYLDHSRLKAFLERHALSDYQELLTRSTTDLAWFWHAVLTELGIEFYRPYDRLMDKSRGIPWTRWCVGGSLNIVHNCLDKWNGTSVEDRPALRWEG